MVRPRGNVAQGGTSTAGRLEPRILAVTTGCRLDPRTPGRARWHASTSPGALSAHREGGHPSRPSPITLFPEISGRSAGAGRVGGWKVSLGPSVATVQKELWSPRSGTGRCSSWTPVLSAFVAREDASHTQTWEAGEAPEWKQGSAHGTPGAAVGLKEGDCRGVLRERPGDSAAHGHPVVRSATCPLLSSRPPRGQLWGSKRKSGGPPPGGSH